MIYSGTILLSSVILSTFLQCKAQLNSDSLQGSLSNEWNFNFTFFMTDLDGTLLYFADYERNNLIVSITTTANQIKSVTLRYNKEWKVSDIKSLCGCYPCNEKMMNILIGASNKTIELKCNNYGQTNTIRKIDITNKINKHLTVTMNNKLEIMGENRIFTQVFNTEKLSCLESLYHNDKKIRFYDPKSNVLPSCPRSCPINYCNEGKCRALDSNGPMCDCSSTALTGLSCNNSMKQYVVGSNNSYYRTSTTSDLYIKLSWKINSSDHKYCLMEFVNDDTKDSITLTIFGNFLSKGSDVVSNVNSNEINFISINVTNRDVTIKVNNRPTTTRPALVGNWRLNVGFSEKNDQCKVFHGIYYFLHNSSQLRLVLPITSVTPRINAVLTTSEFKIDIKIIILGAGSSLLVTIVFLLILLAIICIRKSQGPKNVVIENEYDFAYRIPQPRRNTNLSVDDHYDSLEYERLNPHRNSLPPTPSMDHPLPDIPQLNSI